MHGTNISENSEYFLSYKNQTNKKLQQKINNSYNIFLNKKYKVEVNEKTLERVKNYFQ